MVTSERKEIYEIFPKYMLSNDSYIKYESNGALQNVQSIFVCCKMWIFHEFFFHLSLLNCYFHFICNFNSVS